jgi:hypothetical protein
MARVGSLRGVVVVAGACAALAVLVSARDVRADEPPSAERLKAAAEEYDRGRRSFLADDFEGAAVHFENAYRDAPRAETLRLAIRARRKAKQLARAATLAAVGEQRYPNDVPTAQLVKETLDEAKPALSELLITCSADCSVAADGRVASQSDAQRHRIFVEPGAHELGVSFKLGGSVQKPITARRGASETHAFDPPPPPVVPDRGTGAGTGAGAGAGAGTAGPPRATKPLKPPVFFIAAGVTVALGAAVVVSGLDAKNNPGVDAVRRACAGKDTSCPEYQSGKSAELRTNILLGAGIGGALITGVIGVFFTQWTSSTPTSTALVRSGVSVGVAPLPGGLALGAARAF